MHTGNDGAFETAAASGKDGVRLSSSARSSSQPVLVTFLMVKYLLSDYKPLTIFQSFDKVDSDSFCQDSQCYRERQPLEIPTLPFLLTSRLRIFFNAYLFLFGHNI